MAKDLVCNMDVDERTAKWKTVYKGKTYYFCALGCKKAFEEEPELYLKAEVSEDQHHKHHHHHEGDEPTDHSCGCGCGHNH
ncbi:MAG: YHS domain-containing protein [Candidatus Bathyarchaeota archaeon]|nr:YHS domain-containing protein [Candidatus Bathyarchaeota archaeon]